MTDKDNQDAYQHKRAFVQAMAELDTKEKNLVASSSHARDYVLSFFLPPIGVYYFVKHVFFSGGERENVKAGAISLFLTLISLFFSLLFMNMFAGQLNTGVSPQTKEMINELSTPENHDKLLELYK